MSDYYHAAEYLSNKLTCLKSIGFCEAHISIEDSKFVGKSLLLIYLSDADRSIEIGYVSASEQRTASTSVFIVGENKKRFSLEDWLTSKELQSRMRFLAEQSESEENFLDEFSNGLCSLLNSSLRATLIGDEWDAVPFNWKGYR